MLGEVGQGETSYAQKCQEPCEPSSYRVHSGRADKRKATSQSPHFQGTFQILFVLICFKLTSKEMIKFS